MEWTDRGIVLATRRHGESGLIVEALTYAHGRHLGLVRGGRSSRQRSAFQPGNSLELTWRARLEDHLGVYTGDLAAARAAGVMNDRLRFSGLATAVSLGRLLPEREPGPRLTDRLETVLDLVSSEKDWLTELVRLEMAILEDLGFGLDLASCALTGVSHDLAWVSPKTGRAANRNAGDAYKAKLLALPEFLVPSAEQRARPVTYSGIVAGLKLTGHFLRRHVYEPRALHEPEVRQALMREVEKLV